MCVTVLFAGTNLVVTDYFQWVAFVLSRYFGTDAQSWLNLQLSYDLKIAEAGLRARIEPGVGEIAA